MITFQDPHRPLQLLPWDGRPFRPQKANVNCQPCDESTNLWTDIQEDEVSFCRSPTDCLWWNLQCRLSADTYVASIQFTSRPQIFQQLPDPLLMGIWTALSPCEMVQGAFVWPQRWSNTAPHQTAGNRIPKLQEQQTHIQHMLVAIQQRSIKWSKWKYHTLGIKSKCASSNTSCLLPRAHFPSSWPMCFCYHHSLFRYNSNS